MPPREFRPKGKATEENGEGGEGDGEGMEEKGVSQGQDRSAGGSAEDGLRTAAEVLQEATRVTPSNAGGGMRLKQRMAEAPPGVESLQTENQRRRALPLSKLKRAKPKKRCVRTHFLFLFLPLYYGMCVMSATYAPSKHYICLKYEMQLFYCRYVDSIDQAEAHLAWVPLHDRDQKGNSGVDAAIEDDVGPCGTMPFYRHVIQTVCTYI